MEFTANWVIICHLPPIKGTRNCYERNVGVPVFYPMLVLMFFVFYYQQIGFDAFSALKSPNNSCVVVVVVVAVAVAVAVVVVVVVAVAVAVVVAVGVGVGFWCWCWCCCCCCCCCFLRHSNFIEKKPLLPLGWYPLSTL